jgi:signal transduction histidine kinase/DNA-binding response OmpR family regulator/streptogramin lyase
MVYGISDGRLLTVDNEETVVLIDPVNDREKQVFSCRESGDRRVFCLMERCPGEFWISTPTGIRVYEEGKGLTGHISSVDNDRMSLSSNYVTDLFADTDGNVWIGTYYRGLNLWHDSDGAYDLFYQCNEPGSLQGRIMLAITPDSSGNIWMASVDGKLNRFTPATKAFAVFDLSGLVNNLQDILVQGNQLWVATSGNGLYRYDPVQRRVTAHFNFPDNRFSCLLGTADGSILAGGQDGLYRLAAGTNRFECVTGFSGSPVRALAQDKDGRIWVGLEGLGIRLLDSETDQPETIPGMPDWGSVTSFFEDSHHRMWATTEDRGLFVADSSADSLFRNLTRRDGLFSRNVCSVAEDEEGMLWVSTIKGLLMMNPDNYWFTTVFEDSQIIGNQYTSGAAYRDSGGTIYLGTTDGVFAFNPVDLRKRHENREVFITSIFAMSGDRVIPLSSPGASPQESKRIRISHKDISTLSITFSSPQYSNIQETRYECTFSSRKSDVTVVTSYNFAQYADIGYGMHTFSVGVLGNDDPGARKSLEIYVVPPFWKSTLGIILLSILLLGTGFLAWYFIRRWRETKHRNQQEKLEQMRQRELYESRYSFFTNITHEIRTPLTLIKMPLDKIIRSKAYAPSAEKDILVIQSNTDRLLSLTNQLLDLKKLENGEEKLKFTRQNICDTIRRTCERFAPMAAEQEVSLKVDVPDEIVDVMYAKDSVEKIVSNLLSNALKYGGGLIRITLEHPSDKTVAIRVDSNGRHIPAGEREKIFEKFYQGGKGTGLGLPLARALAELHGGRLYLDAERTDMNSFVLELPVEHPEQVEVPPPTLQEEGNAFKEYDSTRSSLLFVEDNQEFRLYLAQEFSEEYNVFLAANGKMALDLLKTQRIDLVISDIMMPLMDGCELCNEIKTNPEFSHIPVLLLTAAVGTDTRIKTLGAGADGYIEKPFPIELLRANITNLFHNKEIAFRQFTSSPLAHFSSAASKVDESFMERMHKIIMDNLAENNLSLDELASRMNVSSSTLYRKVKANTGMNVNEYIRVCRLKRAAELLATKQYRINEVADMLGFSSSSYFAANFQKQFNVSPSAFVKSLN